MNLRTAFDPARLSALWSRYKNLVAVGSFLLGIASLLLIQRQEKVAQTLVVVLPLIWLLAVLEPWWTRLAARGRWLRYSPTLLRYLLQGMHQEAFFFTLPFFLAATTWSSPQPVFVVLVGGLALITMIDPIYIERVAVTPALLWTFHAASAFVTVLAAAPMLWHITTATSLWLAIGAGSIVAVPAIAAALPGSRWLRWPAALLGAALLAAALSFARFAIPPATLRVYQAHATQTVDAASHRAGARVWTISAEALRANGLYVWTRIHAPRGLSERVIHEWRREGHVVDRIPITIVGNREAGYRTWTRKTVFDANPRGDWQVRVLTESDQLIGVVRFTVE